MTEEALKKNIAGLAGPIAHSLGLMIWGIEIFSAGRAVVRLYVDVPNSGSKDASGPLSATIDQCEEISRHLALALEVEDSVAGPYTLEVSTPGFSRIFFDLDQMRRYLGDMVEIRLHAPAAAQGAATAGERETARRVWRGRLIAVQSSDFVIEPTKISDRGDIIPEDLKPVRLLWSNVRRANRLHVFKHPVKPGKKSAVMPHGGPHES